MKLLIVDDIPSVAKGLCEGISWRDQGFTSVYTAYNAMEARAILKRETIDVMLCDIQMPVENGLDLYAWMCKQGFKVRTIFLTSHAEFEYAQKAIKLGGFDYILQPAPYSEIFQAVGRAVTEIEKEKKLHKNVTLGRVFQRQEYMLASNCFRDVLYDNPNWGSYEALEKMGRLPDRKKPHYLVLLQIQHWETEEKWEPGLFHMALYNISNEIFEDYCQVVSLTMMEDDVYVLGLPFETLADEGFERQMYYFLSVCQQYFSCTAAIYISEPIALEEAASVWERLKTRMQENITLAPGIHRLEKRTVNAYIYRVPEIAQWGMLLKDGYPETMEESAYNLLDAMVNSGKMNAKTLMVFQLDFVEMLRSATEGGDNYLTNILDTPDKIEIYRNSARSVNQMKSFIHLIVENSEKKEDPFNTKTLVERITRYINEHIDSDLKRDDLAAFVNLSPDYMTRIFKKEMGMPIKEYIIQQKMQIAQKLLQTTNLPVSFIAAKVGYSNFSHFSHTYKKEMGITPLEERKTVE